MYKASLNGLGLVNNRIFDTNDPWNRDNSLLPYIELKAAFSSLGIELNTGDKNKGNPVQFEIHQNVCALTNGTPSYLLLFEAKNIYPANGNPTALAKYRKIFTWDDSLVDGDRFIKFNFPNPIVIPEVSGFSGRDRFCCMISGNKSSAHVDPLELYTERVRVIRWFEKNAPADFDLYGVDWDLPPTAPGLIGKIIKRLWRYASRVHQFAPFPSYRGKVANKQDVLKSTRYAMCYENVRDLDGYITEKIFDCFFSGCVPVYWGARNVTDVIPSDCFIDRRDFKNTAEVYAFLKSIDEATYSGYQHRIAAFLQSKAAIPFSSTHFAQTIVQTIVNDLER